MMPSIDNWRITPLKEVGQIFDAAVARRNQEPVQDQAAVAADDYDGGNHRPPSWKEAVKTFFAAKFEEPNWRTQIPDLDVIPNHELVDGQLVRFRGMIQVIKKALRRTFQFF